MVYVEMYAGDGELEGLFVDLYFIDLDFQETETICINGSGYCHRPLRL